MTYKIDSSLEESKSSRCRQTRGLRRVASAACCAALFVTASFAADLSQYREFRLGMAWPAVVKATKSVPSDTRILHRKPVLLQELSWRPQYFAEFTAKPDPVRTAVFTFYDGSLYRMLITYDDSKTEGLTPGDLTDALVGIYGAATHPVASLPVTSEGIDETATVLSQWEDADSLVRLVRISYRDRIALLLTSKRFDAMAATAALDSKRIEELEAPQRDAAKQKQQAEDERLALLKARTLNKPNFRP